MRALRTVLAACLAFATLPAWSSPAELEIKGLRIGMSEGQFKKLYPKAACAPSAREAGWDATIARRRTCSIQGFTLANRETQSTAFYFYEGKLGSWDARFSPLSARYLRSALEEKFGAPEGGFRAAPAKWQFDAVAMTLHSASPIIVLEVTSPVHDAWQEKLRAFERKPKKADL